MNHTISHQKRTKLLANQNDTFRREVVSKMPIDAFLDNRCCECLSDHKLRGCVVIDHQIVEMDKGAIAAIINYIIQFQQFNLNDDPSGEHCIGKFRFQDKIILWKIFCSDAQKGNQKSRNPIDPAMTIRILNITLAPVQ